MKQNNQSKALRHPRADGGLWCNLTGFMDSRLRGNDEKGKICHAEFNHPRHSELVSESRNKLRKTLSKVQGDDNYINVILSKAKDLGTECHSNEIPRSTRNDSNAHPAIPSKVQAAQWIPVTSTRTYLNSIGIRT